jgi:hypothetical protein
MKKKPTPFLDLYKKWGKTGKMTDEGLCFALPKDLFRSEVFELIEPTEDDDIYLRKRKLPRFYWGRGSFEYGDGDFTPLRQTIMLFCAALNGEFD